ncbi:hypothetical protein ACH4LN_30295 [Streptomyces albus]|uniref:Uncharacterized protein n=1 Tax=Streptomyces albus TaxID=1888 RepID=A0A6C1BYD7_9ACTN|nr:MULTISPECIES: hypothetical protein [Streptomyces]MDI6407419.1 hypothetical protein [Streptomyces albus]QID35784.1 hypothetical protein G3260_001812 [Streptomyces albus]TGG89706.1 hypothetical protein D8771_02115 [Streptomyces albus]UVN57424.1 hypothetical protein NR995_25060 [Streptomyces albus]GHJ19886.1 hypothetical protein TPA0909_15000 [Streptomyces albus]
MTVTPKTQHGGEARAEDTAAESRTAAPGTRSRRRLRSSTVVLGSMGALAVALSGYSSEPDKRCVDPGSYDAVRGYRVLPPQQCETGAATAASFPSAAAGVDEPGGAGRAWYYGGHQERGHAKGGTFVHAAAVERAGFGCDDDDDGGSGGSGGTGGYGG